MRCVVNNEEAFQKSKSGRLLLIIWFKVRLYMMKRIEVITWEKYFVLPDME